MYGVLNTNTVHRHETDGSGLATACGTTKHVARNRLQEVAVDRAIADSNAEKCGRCFAKAGGY